MSFGRVGYYAPPKDRFPELNPYRTPVAPRRHARPMSVDSMNRKERGFEVRKGHGIDTSIPGYESMADPHLLGHFRQAELRTFMMETGVLGRDMTILLSASSPHKTYQQSETVLTSKPRSHVWSTPTKSPISSRYSPSSQATTNRGSSRSHTSGLSFNRYRAEVTTPNKWTSHLSSPNYSPYESELVSPQSRGNSTTERTMYEQNPRHISNQNNEDESQLLPNNGLGEGDGDEVTKNRDNQDSLESSIQLTSLTEHKSEPKIEIDDYEKGDNESNDPDKDQEGTYDAIKQPSNGKSSIDEQKFQKETSPSRSKPKSKKKEKLSEARELAKKYATYDDSNSESEQSIDDSNDDGPVSSATFSLQVSYSNGRKDTDAEEPVSQEKLPNSRFSSDSVASNVDKATREESSSQNSHTTDDSDDDTEAILSSANAAHKAPLDSASKPKDQKSEETTDTFQKLFQSSTTTEHSQPTTQSATNSEIPEEIVDKSSEQSKQGPKQMLDMDAIDALLED